MTDAGGDATTYAYDNLNRKTSETDPEPDGPGCQWSHPVNVDDSGESIRRVDVQLTREDS